MAKSLISRSTRRYVACYRLLKHDPMHITLKFSQDSKPKSLVDLKKKISGKGFKPKGDKFDKSKTFDKSKKQPKEVSAPVSKNAAKAASQPNYSHKPYSKLVSVILEIDIS